MKARIVGLLLLTACATTYRLQRVEGERPSINPETWTEVHCTGSEVESSCAADFAPVRSALAVDAGALQPVLRFVHLSDAKLREHRVLLATEGEKTGVTDATDRLYRNDDAVLLATVLGANQLHPQFAIHTGNAVNTGLFSELMQFIAAMDEFDVPWFNAIGPRDVAFLGALPAERVSGLHVALPYMPIADVDHFMAFHSLFGVSADVTLPNPEQRGVDHVPSQRGCVAQRGVSCLESPLSPRAPFHGFQLSQQDGDKPNQLSPHARGYYTFQVPGADGARTFTAIVLNSAESVLDDGVSGTELGRMLPEQVRWFREQLERVPADGFALVFAHHPLDAFRGTLGQDLLAIMQADPRVLGYFHGGGRDTFELHAREHGTPLPDFGAGSLFDFPQLARSVEVLAADDGRLFVRSSSFHQPMSSTSARPAAAPITTVGKSCAAREATSWCYRLATRAGVGRTASTKLVPTAGFVEAAGEIAANRLVLAYHPGSP